MFAPSCFHDANDKVGLFWDGRELGHSGVENLLLQVGKDLLQDLGGSAGSIPRQVGIVACLRSGNQVLVCLGVRGTKMLCLLLRVAP